MVLLLIQNIIGTKMIALGIVLIIYVVLSVIGCWIDDPEDLRP